MTTLTTCSIGVPVSGCRIAAPFIVAAVLMLGACGGDDPAAVAPIVPPGTAPDDGTATPGTGGPDGTSTEGDVGTSSGQRDRAGLAVRLPADADPDIGLNALSSPWLAVIDVFQNAAFPVETGELYVDLVRYTDDVAFGSHVDFYTPGLDTCEILAAGSSGEENEGNEGNVDDVKRSVSGGEAVILSSAGGPWASVPYRPDEQAYTDDGGFPGPIPADLTLSLPGDEFPAVAPLAIDAPDAPERLSPAIGEPITPETEYRWVPADDGTVVRIVIKRFVDETFRDVPVDCRVEDDGAFELPSDVLAALAGLPGEMTVRFVRERNTVEFRDGLALFRSIDVADD